MAHNQNLESTLTTSGGTRHSKLSDSCSPSRLSGPEDSGVLHMPQNPPIAPGAARTTVRHSFETSGQWSIDGTTSRNHARNDSDCVKNTKATPSRADTAPRRQPKTLPKDRVWADASIKHCHRSKVLAFLAEAGEDVDAPHIRDKGVEKLGPLVRSHQERYIVEAAAKEARERTMLHPHRPQGYFSKFSTNNRRRHKEELQEIMSSDQHDGINKRPRGGMHTSTTAQRRIRKDQTSQNEHEHVDGNKGQYTLTIQRTEANRKRSRDGIVEDSDDDAFEPVPTGYVYESTRKRLRVAVSEPTSSAHLQDDDAQDDAQDHGSGEHITINKSRAALQEMKRSAICYMRLRKNEEDDEVQSPLTFQFYRYSIVTDQHGNPILPVAVQQIIDGIIRQRPFLQQEVIAEQRRKVVSVGLRKHLEEFKKECWEIAKALSKLIKTEDREKQAKKLVNDILVQDFNEGKLQI